jgi:ribosomal protein S18 acetylase RimI-like enzyme
MIIIRPFTSKDEPAVINLWQDCGLLRPYNNPHQDIARKQTVQPELFLLAVERDRIIGAIMAGYDGHRGWLNYLAVAPEAQRRGIGRQLVLAAAAKLTELGCPRINIQVRNTNFAVIAFYQKLGFLTDEVISMGKRLIEDTPS